MTWLPVRPAVVPTRPGLVVAAAGIVLRPRAAALSAALLALCLLLGVVGVLLGESTLPIDRLLATLTGNGTPLEQLVIFDLRLPRALLAPLVGFALGVSGAITQSVTRNALASPDILGVAAGAGTGAVLVIVGGLGAGAGAVGALGVTAAALTFGLLTAAAIATLAWRSGIDGLRLILAGIGVNALAVAATSYLLIRADLEDAAQATRWLAGSLGGATWPEVGILAGVVLGGGLAAMLAGRVTTALRHDDDTSRTLGVRLTRAQPALLLLAVVMVSAATAAAGPVGFVAFVAPQVALRLLRTAGPPVIAGGLVGALLVQATDLASRLLLPVDLPVGAITSAIGAPFLLFLIIRYGRRTSA